MSAISRGWRHASNAPAAPCTLWPNFPVARGHEQSKPSRPARHMRLKHSGCRVAPDTADAGTARSEEHTSELQSLMRKSDAVFSLKKKHGCENVSVHKNDQNEDQE